MSTEAIRLSRPSAALAVLPVAAGLMLLMARVQILTSGSARDALLAVTYCLLLAVSLAAPLLRGRSVAAIPAGWVTLVGVATFAAISAAPWQTHVVTPWRVGGLALGIGAAVAEEAFFRRLLFDLLLPAGTAAAVIGSAVVFALVHVPLYGTSVLWVDLGAGLLLSWQRLASGSWLSPAISHSFANALAVLR